MSVIATEPILRWTEHPLVDAGVAGITAFAHKSDPSEVTAADLEEFARFAERAFFTPVLSGYLTVLFPNYINFARSEGDNRAIAAATLRSFAKSGTEDAEPCTFCDRAMIQRVSRDLVPMIGSRSTINFFPSGEAGLPVCGSCLTALQALTIGAPYCSGRALVLSSTSKTVMVRLIGEWFEEFRNLVGLVQAAGAPVKLRGARTRVIELLIRAQKAALDADDDATLVAYHLSNSGQGPDIEVHVLSASIVSFIRRAQLGNYAADWNVLSRRGWEQVKGVPAVDVGDAERLNHRNFFYENLFRLPQEAPSFIRRYFLQRPAQFAPKKRKGDKAPQEAEPRIQVVSWRLVDLFLREVMNMDRARVEAIRELGDRLAEHIHEEKDKRLFLNAFRIRNNYYVRRLLLDTSFRRLRANDRPMVTFDEYLTIFEEGEEVARADWRLAWDLVLIRVIEQLQELKSEVITDPDVQNEAEAAMKEDSDANTAEDA